ncbi:hypothetical protein GE061_007991 [Apolygus lucorum]|uniref:Uncharacterized protein n=1 Tax=Apolygus lucorum TaxID=248454 RepID=A0A6A4IT57_APOLU|nr:hypothetical protein GE061_007991 [Apolygus lucorum]
MAGLVDSMKTHSLSLVSEVEQPLVVTVEFTVALVLGLEEPEPEGPGDPAVWLTSLKTERACSALEFVKIIKSELENGETQVVEAVSVLFSGDINPVAPKAQRIVQVPDGLDLDAWINDPP